MMALVLWVGYTRRHDSWIPVSELKTLQQGTRNKRLQWWSVILMLCDCTVWSVFVTMLLTILSQFFRRSNSTDNNGGGGSVTIKIFLYCSIPTFFLSSGLTLFISSFSMTKVTVVQTTPNFTLPDQMTAQLQIRFPLPDSYIEDLNIKWQNNSDFHWHGKDLCAMKNSLMKCLNKKKNCHLKKTENKALFDLLEKIVLC